LVKAVQAVLVVQLLGERMVVAAVAQHIQLLGALAQEALSA
jgi:hypothetical protein